MNSTIAIYGDSIMKGTVVTQSMRYKATICEYLDKLKTQFGLNVESRARFGMTVERGSELLSKDMENGVGYRCALLEFGGNDCDYNWEEIAEKPNALHQAKTPMPKFISLYAGMIEKLQNAGIVPLMMTLPPISAEKYLSFICRNGDKRESIMLWLKDVQRIYRTQERYSNAVARIAAVSGVELIDVRAHFLAQDDLTELIGSDGIHPTSKGYELIYEAFRDFINSHESLYRSLCVQG